jgi:hypothetical protein
MRAVHSIGGAINYDCHRVLNPPSTRVIYFTLECTDVHSEVCEVPVWRVPVKTNIAYRELNASVTSSSAFPCLNLSCSLVTMGRMDASAEFDVKGIGVVRAGGPWK